MADQRWQVDLAAPVGDMEEWTRVNDVCEKAAGVGCVSAGTGFGCRDMQFEFDTEAEANAARDRLLASGLTFEHVDVAPLEDHDDPEHDD